MHLYLSICLSIFLYEYRPDPQSDEIHARLSGMCMRSYLSIYLYLYLCISIFLSIYLSIDLSSYIYLVRILKVTKSMHGFQVWVYVHIYLSSCLYLYLCISIYLSIYLYIYISSGSLKWRNPCTASRYVYTASISIYLSIYICLYMYI